MSTLYAPVNTIRTVLIDPISAVQVNNQSLFSRFQDILSGRNITDVQRGDYQEVLTRMQSVEPFVGDFEVNKQSDYTVILTIYWRQPLLIIQHQDKRMARSDGGMIVLSTGDLLGSGVAQVSLPMYMSGHSIGSGLFFGTSLTGLVAQVSMIQQRMPQYRRMIWMPAARRIGVSLPPQSLVWFGLGNTLQSQIDRYELLSEYYPSTQQLREVDMSSQQTIIVKE